MTGPFGGCGHIDCVNECGGDFTWATCPHALAKAPREGPLPPPPRDPPAACESSRDEPLLSENTSLRGRVEGLETALREIVLLEADPSNGYIADRAIYIARAALAQGADHG